MDNQSRYLFTLSPDEFLTLLDSRYEKRTQPEMLIETPTDELLTLSEVCSIFKKTRQTIRNWVKAKQLSVKVIGGSNFYSKNEIQNKLGKKFQSLKIK